MKSLERRSFMELLLKDWNIKYYCLGVNKNGDGCGALLEIEAQDIYAIIKLLKKESSNTSILLPEYYYTFRCPCCNIETEITSFLPPEVRKNVLLKLKRSLKEIKINGNGRIYL